MNIVQPDWKLKSQRCPCCCGGEGFLVFRVCPNCGHIVLICDEIGTAFPNPHDSAQGQQLTSLGDSAVTPSNDKCPKCGDCPLSDFDYANSTQIQAAGFKVGEYY